MARLAELADEILLPILAFVRPLDILRLTRTNRHFHRLIEANVDLLPKQDDFEFWLVSDRHDASSLSVFVFTSSVKKCRFNDITPENLAKMKHGFPSSTEDNLTLEGHDFAVFKGLSPEWNMIIFRPKETLKKKIQLELVVPLLVRRFILRGFTATVDTRKILKVVSLLPKTIETFCYRQTAKRSANEADVLAIMAAFPACKRLCLSLREPVSAAFYQQPQVQSLQKLKFRSPTSRPSHGVDDESLVNSHWIRCKCRHSRVTEVGVKTLVEQWCQGRRNIKCIKLRLGINVESIELHNGMRIQRQDCFQRFSGAILNREDGQRLLVALFISIEQDKPEVVLRQPRDYSMYGLK